MAPVAMKEAITSVMAQTSVPGAQPTPAPVLGIIVVWLSPSTYSQTRHAKLLKPLALKDFHALHVLGASLLCGCIYIIHVSSSVCPPRAEELLTTLNIFPLGAMLKLIRMTNNIVLPSLQATLPPLLVDP